MSKKIPKKFLQSWPAPLWVFVCTIDLKFKFKPMSNSVKYEHKERLKDKGRAHELEKMRHAHEFQCQLMRSFMFGQGAAFTSPSPPSLSSSYTDELTEEL
jgi:hypothetical protein